MKKSNAITDVPGIQVGHAHDQQAQTGCTVILPEGGAVGGVDQRGGAPGTRETDALQTLHLVENVHGVLLSGGSAFGLEAAGGVMRYLEERQVGFNAGAARVPIVPAAIIFDLGLGRADVRPDAEMGYQACLNASAEPPLEGNVGAGTGATIGKILGMGQAMKSGIGSSSLHLGRGVVVGAIAVVNAFGDIIDPANGTIVAGARSLSRGPLRIGEPGYFADTMAVMRTLVGRTILAFAMREHTVIAVVASNARLNKEQTNKVAQMAQDGIARAVRPAHTMFDGDTVFALSTGKVKADVNIVGAFGAEVLAQAILRAVHSARSVGELPGAADLLISNAPTKV
jgi:L-aminopeptidase/D-esterase-like protein